MPTLRELWPNLDGNLLKKFGNRHISKVSCNSKNVSSGDLFVAVKGASCDGHQFIDEAIRRGAGIIVIEEDNNFIHQTNKAVFVKVSNSRLALAELAASFYGNPAQKVKVIGITGTNGKTTVSYLLERILDAAGFSAGIIGTINYKIKDRIISATNTTPGPLELQSYLAQMVDKRIEFCAMEVSSHSLDQERIRGIDFQGAIFTNLASDHLDYHLTVENYFAAKAKLFENLKDDAFAAINLDDTFSQELIKLTRAKVVTYALERNADFTAQKMVWGLNGTNFLMVAPGGEIEIQTKLLGRHNVYNILAAASLSAKLGIDLKTVKKGVESLGLVPGRLENIDCGQSFKVLVDFAHTEDALKNVLSTLREISKSRLLLLFGCGGNRDRTKREKMGRVADELADFSIITSDNPRNENPKQIAEEIVKGFRSQKYKIVLDRLEAIKEVISLAQKDDIVIIAGKGHESYQIFNDRAIPFDDRIEAEKILNGLRHQRLPDNQVTP